MVLALLFSLMLDGPAPDATPAATQQPPAPTLVLPKAGDGIYGRPAPAQPPVGTDTVQKALRFLWREHPSIRTARNFRLDLTMKYQEDGRDPGDPPPLDFQTWEVHRMRFGVEGVLFRHIQYQIERETKSSLAANPLKSPWRDVYVETDYINNAQVRVGKFKIPFGLDAQGGDSSLDFVFRSLGGTHLAPGRDIGAMVHGRFFERGLNYWVGGFNQDGENARTAKTFGGDRSGAGRLSFRPFRKLKGPFAEAEIGTDFVLSKVSDDKFLDDGTQDPRSVLPNGLRGRTVVTEYNFFESVFVKGQRRRLGVDFDWAAGPFGAQAEFLQVSETRDAQGLGNQDLSDARARSWYAVGSYVITGENKSGGVVPKKGLGMGGAGAVEGAIRYDQLKFDSKVGQDPPFRNSRAETIFPEGDRVWTFGVNWYVNRWVKLQVNAIREHATDVERSPTLDGAAYWSKVFRFQFEL